MCRLTLSLVLVLASLGFYGFAGAQETNIASPKKNQRPNILFLFADDQRTDTIAANGNKTIKTPNLDALANSGVNFRRAYCFGSIHGAVCQPSRAMLHSGRTLFRVNMQLKDTPTMGQMLRESGYVTFGTGKWHNGEKSFSRSFQKGTNIFFGGMSDHEKVPVRDLKSDGSFTEKSTGGKFSSELFADSAIEFIETQRGSDSPFFCYVSFTAPHDPRQPPGKYRSMYDPAKIELPKNFMPQHPFDNGRLVLRDEVLAAWPRKPETIRSQIAEYYGLVTHLDHQIGRIVQSLKKNGFDQNTIIIYAADHGLALGSHGLLGKQNLYEHSMRAPMIVVGPGIQPGNSHSLVYLHDLFPTVLEFAMTDLPEQVEGKSLVKPLLGQRQVGQAMVDRQYLFTAYENKIRAVTDDRWKFIRYPVANRNQLFDLKNDPAELNDLSDSKDHQDQMTKMEIVLKACQTQWGDPHPFYVDKKLKPVDLSNVKRQADRHQPKWIVDKYFPAGEYQRQQQSINKQRQKQIQKKKK